MNRRIGLAALPVLAVAALLASCRDSAEPEEISVAGFWDLWSLDGQAMPVSVDIVTITLNPNDGCANTAVLEERNILKVSSHCAEGLELVLVR